MSAETIVVGEPEEYLRALIKNFANEKNYKNFNFKITSKFQKGENYLGEIQRAVVRAINENDEEEIVNLIIKTPPQDLALRKEFSMNALYRREMYSYRILLQTLDKLQDKYDIPEEEKFKHAKCYTTSTEDLKEVLIFEDLNAKKFKMIDRLKPLDYDHLMLIMKTMAKYHALSFAAKEKLPKEVYEDFKNNVTNKNDMGTAFVEYLTSMKNSVTSYLDNEDHRRRFSNFFKDGDLYDNYCTYVNIQDRPEEDPYFIITHGDTWSNNMLFKYEDGKPSEMVFVDWQITKYTSPLTDLTYLLFSCTDEDLRINSWEEILDTYYGTLKSRLIDLDCDPDKCYPETVFKRDLKKNIEYGLLMAIILVPLVLNSREDSLNLSDILDEDGFQPDQVKHSAACVTRLRGIVKHCVLLNII